MKVFIPFASRQIILLILINIETFIRGTSRNYVGFRHESKKKIVTKSKQENGNFLQNIKGFLSYFFVK